MFNKMIIDYGIMVSNLFMTLEMWYPVLICTHWWIWCDAYDLLWLNIMIDWRYSKSWDPNTGTHFLWTWYLPLKRFKTSLNKTNDWVMFIYSSLRTLLLQQSVKILCNIIMYKMDSEIHVLEASADSL